MADKPHGKPGGKPAAAKPKYDPIGWIVGFILVLAVLSHTPFGKNISLDFRNYASSTDSLPQDPSGASTITAADNGKTFTVYNTSRFFINLKESEYPYKNLTFVTRGATFGRISNGGGVNAWPFYGEANLVDWQTVGEVDIVAKGVEASSPDFKFTLQVVPAHE